MQERLKAIIAGFGCNPPSPDYLRPLSADITEARERIENLAQTDSLTGLYNVRMFNEVWQREHEACEPGPPMMKGPEAVEHHREQHEIGLTEIEHIENEGDRDDGGERDQPGIQYLAIARHCVGQLGRQPPCGDVKQRQAKIERDFSEKGRDREQDRRQRRIQKIEIGVWIVRIKISAL